MISPGTLLTLSMILMSTLLVSLDSLKLNTEQLKLSFPIIFSCRNFLTNLTETSHKLLFCSVPMLRKGLLRQTLPNTNFIFYFLCTIMNEAWRLWTESHWLAQSPHRADLPVCSCVLRLILQCSPIQFSYFHIRTVISRFPLSKVVDGTERTAQCRPVLL